MNNYYDSNMRFLNEQQDNYKVCILLATFNGEKWLGEQLDTLLNQSYQHIDIYISDDHSADKTLSVIDTYRRQHTNIFLLKVSKKFGNAAQNFFRLLLDVDLSEYKYIAFSDQDDIWEKEKVNLAIRSLKNKNAAVYSSNVIAFWPEGKLKLINKAQPQKVFDYMFESAGPGCTFVMSQHFACELKRFLLANQRACKNIIMHDWFIYAFARNAGYHWFIDNHPTMLYRQHVNNAIGANVGLSSFLARLRLIREGWYRDQIILTANAIGYANNWVIKRLKRLSLIDRLVLAVNVTKFRRKWLDQIAFVFLVFLMQKNRNRHK